MSFASCVRKVRGDLSTKDTRPNPVMFSESVKDAASEHSDMICAGQVDKKEEADKMAVVIEANAVVHPWTVVV